MTKKRTSIPKATAEKVMKEFRHLCAICGRHDPQLHHIDEDPSNNDHGNLLPLCPNCHLQDTHAPTDSPDAQKIRLFRRTKDPFVLDPRFHPVWTRLGFLRESDDKRTVSWQWSCNDLLGFVEALKMGDYYSKRIRAVLKQPGDFYRVAQKRKGREIREEELNADESLKMEAIEYRAEAIEDLCVEMLRYQGWQATGTSKP